MKIKNNLIWVFTRKSIFAALLLFHALKITIPARCSIHIRLYLRKTKTLLLFYTTISTYIFWFITSLFLFLTNAFIYYLFLLLLFSFFSFFSSLLQHFSHVFIYLFFLIFFFFRFADIIDTVPRMAAVLYNDSCYMAHNCTLITHIYKEDLGKVDPSLEDNSGFIDFIPKFR